MGDKNKITYWLSAAGECSPEVQIMSTKLSRVPDVGEVISFDTRFDKTWGEIRFRHLSEEQREKMFPKGEEQIYGDFVVVSSKRYLQKRWDAIEAGKLFAGASVGTNSTSMISPEIPVEYSWEDFEVVVEPFRHTELTETPIAKLRNLLGSLFATIDLLNLVKEHPDKEKELREMFFDSLKTANETMPKIRELIGNDKNWR